MRRTVLLLTTILLSVATAATLTIAAMTMASSSAGRALPVRGEGAAKETVRRFYEAVNEAIATGDLAPVESILTPEFVDHGTAPAPSVGRPGFLDRLANIRAVFPDLRLAVDALSVDGDLIVAQVHADEGGRGRIAGVPISALGDGWSVVDRFRLEDGRIAERWTAPGQTTNVEPLAAGVVVLDVPAARYLSLERIVLEPGDELPRMTDSDPRILLVVSGTLTVYLDEDSKEPALIEPTGGCNPRAIAPGHEGIVAVGEHLLVAGDRWHPFTLRNDTSVPAEALSMRLDVPAVRQAVDDWANVSDGSPWPTVTQLAGSRPEPMSRGNATIQIARAVLAPGASLLPEAASGPLVVAVQSGLLLVAADPALVVITEPTGIRPHRPGETQLGPGGGVQLSSGAAALTSIGTEPAEVLIATVTFALTDGETASHAGHSTGA